MPALFFRVGFIGRELTFFVSSPPNLPQPKAWPYEAEASADVYFAIFSENNVVLTLYANQPRRIPATPSRK